MRVTSNTFTNDLLDQLGSLSAQQTRLQQQAASGQRISLPGDDAVATGRVLDMQAEAKLVAQYKRNVMGQQQISQASFEAIQGLKKIADRASEIATLADGLKSPESMTAYASEVAQLIHQGLQLANAKFDNRFLFGGTRSDQPPFASTLNPDGTVASVTYSGNSSLPSSEIAEGITTTAHSLGANSTASGPPGLLMDSRSGADLLNHLVSLHQHLVSGDTAAIAASDRSLLTKDEDNLIHHLATAGAVQSRLETAADMAETRLAALEKGVSAEIHVDLAQTLVQLSQTQTAYQAALQTGASVLRLSLLDYLR